MSDAGPDFGRYGLAVGHATDDAGATGCTVVRGVDGPVRAVAAVFGRATGTRELGAIAPDHLVGRADAILLTGGSAYGLDAAAGVMRWMEERRRGFDVGVGVVPIVPAAVLFDLGPLGAPTARPTPEMAYAACESATTRDVAEGSVGAGTGATVGKAAGAARAMKGGFGVAESRGFGVAVAAVAAVNAFGDVRDAAGAIIAGARAEDGGWVDSARVLASGGARPRFASADPDASRGAGSEPAPVNTTLCLVATDVVLDRVALAQLARAAGAALFRRITPCGTSWDGDVVFATCPSDGRPATPTQAAAAEALAVRALEEAIERAVRRAVGRDGIPGLAHHV